ncbi:MAG: 3-phosphoshikimate 1-carboxyvinyltransferase, partial [Chloroflexi bacterium]|nr:3-phosphoshikimate 1-carboxyvinyltransferase [Chloroflexota bacterium]
LAVGGGTRLHGGRVEAAGDHRLAMLGAAGALIAEGDSQIECADAVGVSYPAFWSDLERLGSA